MEKGNLLAAELKTLGIKMLNELSENFNGIKKDQLKNTLTEMKSNLQEISR